MADESDACTAGLSKTIVLVTDGEPFGGVERFGALHNPRIPTANSGRGRNLPTCCQGAWTNNLSNYNQAAADVDEGTFNRRFASMVAADGTFNATGADRFVDALITAGDSLMDTSARRSSLRALVQSSDLSPWDVFRGYDPEVIDVLVDPANEFGFAGRPALPGRHYCDASSMYGPYGRINDTVYAGDTQPAVVGAAAFSASRLAAAAGACPSRVASRTNAIRERLETWLTDACAVAGARGVNVEAIYIGGTMGADNRRAIAGLEACVDEAGGSPAIEDVHVTPTPAALVAAFEEILTTRARLVFR